MIIGISGGTGSGKTTVANRILESVRADEVVFMADGAVVETGPPERILKSPEHERTRQFLARVLA